MEFDEIIKKRKSTRKFTSKKVKWDLVLEMIDAANQGPFASNINNIKWVIIEEEDAIQKISDSTNQDWVQDSSIIVAVCTTEENLKALHDEKGLFYTKQHCASAINTFLLKATDLKIGSCWIGEFDEETVRSIIAIPAKVNVHALIALGYEKGEEEKKKKKDLDQTIFWEKWDNSKRPEFIQEPKDQYSMLR